MSGAGAFSVLLRRLRADAGMTQEELASLAGLSTRAISDLERGVNVTARRETARLLADALGLAGEVRALFMTTSRRGPPDRRVGDPELDEPAEVVSMPSADAEAVHSAGPFAASRAGTARGGERPMASEHEVPARSSMWHFPDGGPVTLVSQRLSPDRRYPAADPESLNYVRSASMADLDTLIDVYAATSTFNPRSQISMVAAQDLTYKEIGSHLVLVGGLLWPTAAPRITRILSTPVVLENSGDGQSITVLDPERGELVFKPVLGEAGIVEDVGLFATGANPAAQHRTLTICGGITTRGVRGAARCFIDRESGRPTSASSLRDFPMPLSTAS